MNNLVRHLCFLFCLFVCFFVLSGIIGCRTVFYREVQGTELVIGIPVSEQADSFNLDILQYLSGHIVQVKDPSYINHTYKSSISNEYFSVIKINEISESKTNIKPNITENEKKQ